MPVKVDEGTRAEATRTIVTCAHAIDGSAGLVAGMAHAVLALPPSSSHWSLASVVRAAPAATVSVLQRAERTRQQ